MQKQTLDLLKRLASGIAGQFGSNCEVLVHDLTAPNKESTVVYIENGHVTNRRLGDGPSHVVLEALKKDPKKLQDHIGYTTRTKDGKILKSSTIYVRDENDNIEAILSINYDITGLMMAETSLQALTGSDEKDEAENITTNVADPLDDLLDQSVKLIGKPVALMTKDEKVRAINFLNDAGALLITKSSDKIAEFYGISRYSLYSYIDQNK